MKIAFEFVKIIQKNRFIKYYSFAVGIAILIDWLMMPLFIKLMGIYAPLVLISIYYIISEMAGYIEYLFEHTKIRKVFLFLIISDITQVLSMFIYFYNLEIFTYIMMAIFSFQALLYEIYNIKSIQYIEKYEKEVAISKFQSLLLFNKTNMVFAALCIGLIYFSLTSTYDYLIVVIIMLGILNLYNEIKLYRYVNYSEHNDDENKLILQI